MSHPEHSASPKPNLEKALKNLFDDKKLFKFEIDDFDELIKEKKFADQHAAIGEFLLGSSMGQYVLGKRLSHLHGLNAKVAQYFIGAQLEDRVLEHISSFSKAEHARIANGLIAAGLGSKLLRHLEQFSLPDYEQVIEASIQTNPANLDIVFAQFSTYLGVVNGKPERASLLSKKEAIHIARMLAPRLSYTTVDENAAFNDHEKDLDEVEEPEIEGRDLHMERIYGPLMTRFPELTREKIKEELSKRA